MGMLNSTAHPVWLIAFALALSVVPILIGISTSYLKVSIVMGMLRSGLAAQQVPSNMVVMALSLVITLFVMGPVFSECLNLLSKETISFDNAPNEKELNRISIALTPWVSFIKKHAGKEEIKSFTALKIARTKIEQQSENNAVQAIGPQPDPSKNIEDPDLIVLLASFMVTELKEAFAMGFVLLLPFLVIDLIVSNLLVGMGMFMVSPAMITLPLKLMLFIVCDGWMLLTKGLVMSYV